MLSDYLVVLIPVAMLLAFFLLIFFTCWWLERRHDQRRGIRRVRMRGFAHAGDLVFLDEAGRGHACGPATKTVGRALVDGEPGDLVEVKILKDA